MQDADKNDEDECTQENAHPKELSFGGDNVVRTLGADIHMHVFRALGEETAPLLQEIRFTAVLVAIISSATTILQLRACLDGNLTAFRVDLTLVSIIRG